jgi:SRSO17 transposase
MYYAQIFNCFINVKMDARAQRLEEYVSLMAKQLGHADRVEPFRGYCTELPPVSRKSVEPMAAYLAPANVRSEHQRQHHFVADAVWSDEAVLSAVRTHVLERVGEQAGRPEALIVDDKRLHLFCPRAARQLPSITVRQEQHGEISFRRL